MKTKLILILSTLILFACSNEYVLQANLGILFDNTHHFNAETSNDTDTLWRRRMDMLYNAVNESHDSIFLPPLYDYTRKDSIVAKIEGHDSIQIKTFWTRCSKRNGRWQTEFAPGDSIAMTFILVCIAKNESDSEWLHETKTKDLLKVLKIELMPQTTEINGHRLTPVYFNNTAPNININPVKEIDLSTYHKKK